MGKGRPRAVEKGVLTHGYATTSSSAAAPALPQAPVFHPTEEEFANPLEFIAKIRPQAERFGICRIVPPPSWNPPFAADRQGLSFPTKSQAIHRLQARPPSCDPKTFDLEYARFHESHFGRKPKRRIVFDGEDLDLCRLFNAVKRYGGYAKACREKRWGDVARFLRSCGKISECSKHVLSQLYLEHLLDYEEYQTQLDRGTKRCKRGIIYDDRSWKRSNSKRRKSCGGEGVKEVHEEELDQICEQCKSGLHGEVMLLCDRCDKGWHLHCLSPPLESIPPGNWYCLECVNSDKDSFGFVPGKWCSLEAFQRKDDRLRRKWFGLGRTTRSHIEKQFWDIVEGRAGEVEVMYGSDLDTSVYGSGFPRTSDPIPESIDCEVWKKYCSSPWNLNNFPKLQGSMLRAVRDNIAGVMVPWLYVGMLFSSFCWHVEDHCFYSINYLHWGEPKCWYGVPGSEANAFEQVMRNNLPDLFDAQPDLLFQLVTMLNPYVLQENGVPVYGVLQEPGNFVITFPRSFHGGFNFGLNCAEAVNFAPADWLPHGGFGSELYRKYHKPAVLSHEELLYAVAKYDHEANVSPYLKKEMHRMFSREKTYREELWRNGIVRSILMPPKKHPEYLGNEEDPTCIICQQYLYLSYITCSCRPSVHVCLEHWRHLCECNPNKHRLHYRHSLAELGDLGQMDCKVSESTWNDEDITHCMQDLGHFNRSSSLTKKVKGGQIAYTQLAEDWVSNSCQIFEAPFSGAAYNCALKEAEQFLWADHDMDPVRNMANKLAKAQKWAVKVRKCVSRVENCFQCDGNYIEKASLDEIVELLSFDPLPCHEPALTRLKAYAEDAKMLILEIKAALSSHLHFGKLELLCSRAIEFPIHLEETRILTNEISSAKVWRKNARECLSEKIPGAIDMQSLSKLKLEMLELHVQLPEMEEFFDFCREIDSWQAKCKEILDGPLELKVSSNNNLLMLLLDKELWSHLAKLKLQEVSSVQELEVLLRDAENVTASIPELETLKQYYHDACSWRCHVDDVLQKIHACEGHENIVGELSSILAAGKLLRIRVDELSLVEGELEKSRCREKAFKALSVKIPLDVIQDMLREASVLGIDRENLFVNASLVLSAARAWEEKAKFVFGHAADMVEFEDLIRTSEDVFVILPSLPKLQNAVSEAQSWINKSQAFLKSSVHDDAPLLKVDDLKELVTESKLLKIALDEPEQLQSILAHVYDWKQNSCFLLERSMSLLHMAELDSKIVGHLSLTIEELLTSILSAIEIGFSLGYELEEMPKLQHATMALKWSLKALPFCSKIPLIEEIDELLKDVDHFAGTFSGNNLVNLLIKGLSWLKRACAMVPGPRSSPRFKFEEAEEILKEMPKVAASYPLMAGQLQNAIEKHEQWVEEVHTFFRLSGSWALLLKLMEQGQLYAFSCPELDKVTFEVERIQKWMFQCHALLEPLVGDVGSLPTELAKIRSTLERALSIYHRSTSCKTRAFCVCCSNDSEQGEAFTCLTCGERYHFSCMGPALATAGMMGEYTCSFCSYMQNGALSTEKSGQLVGRGNRPDLNSFIELVSCARDFHAGVEEIPLVQDVVKMAVDCKSFLNEIVDQAFSHCRKDLTSVSESLLCALKATSVAGVYDHQDGCNLKLALCRYSWKVRVDNLLRGSKKLEIQQMQELMEEGVAINIPAEDHFMLEIAVAMERSLQWANTAKKVASDAGAFALNEVFNLIKEGEALTVRFEREMKLLKARSQLYCICRKPYDQRPMIACDRCDEWYHFDCINLHETPPKTFFCPACKPLHGDLISLLPTKCWEERSSNFGKPQMQSKYILFYRSSNFGKPQMPPARHNDSRTRRPRDYSSCSQQNKLVGADLSNILRCYSVINDLWRLNRRPLQRTRRRRNNFRSLTKFVHCSTCK